MGMSQSPDTTDRQYTTLRVSTEYRDKLRLAKAEAGLNSYEEYFRQHLPVGSE